MSSFFRLLLVSALAAVIACPLLAAPKRRSVRAPGGAVSSTNCHTFGFVRAGLKASYLATTPTGSATFTITYIYDTATQSKTTQQVQTPQGAANAETVIDVETVGILRGMKKTKVSTTINVPGFGNVTGDVTLDFVPSLIMGPAAGWCVGNKWAISPVTETITTNSPIAGSQTQVITTVASEGEVLAVGETVTVPAGSFATVKYRGVTIAGESSVQPAITWVSMEHNIVVKQDTLDAAGNVTSTTVLTSL